MAYNIAGIAEHPLDVLRRRTDISNPAKGALFESLSPFAIARALNAENVRKPEGADEGVDFLGDLPDGRLVAIQCKCYLPERSVSQRDIRQFVDEAKSIHRADVLVLMHTSSVSPRAVKVISEHEILVWDYEFLADLPVPWDSVSLAVAPPERRDLLPHQLTALADIDTSDARGQCLMATATGKTLVAIEYGGQRGLALFAVPSLELVRQHIPDIRAQWPEAPILAVSSAKELHEFVPGLPVEFTTDRSETADWLRAHAGAASPSQAAFVMCTYHSGRVLVDAAKDAHVTFDAALFDEAHRTASVSHTPSREGLFHATVSDLPAERFRFFTATPRLHTVQLKDEVRALGGLSFSMDNAELYGPVLHELTYTEARKAGLVVPFSFLVGLISREDVRELVEHGGRAHFEGIDLADPANVEDIANVIHTLRSAREHGLHSVLSVHNSVQRASTAVLLYGAVAAAMELDLRVVSVSGSSDAKRRKKALDLLNEPGNGISVVANVRLFNEGVNAPRVDAVAYFDSRSSAIDVVQTIGRATRLHKASGKTHAVIILPLFVDGTSDVDEAIRASHFDKLYALASALRDGGITVRQWVALLPNKRDIGPLPADTFVVSEPLVGTFDTRLLMDAMESIVSTGSWSTYRDVAAAVESADVTIFVATIKRMREDLLAAGLSEDEAKAKGIQIFNDMVKDASADPVAVLTAMRRS